LITSLAGIKSYLLELHWSIVSILYLSLCGICVAKVSILF